MHKTHSTGLCSQNTGYVPRNKSHKSYVPRNKSHCLNHADSLSYRYMFSKHWLCTEKPVTLSEPCILLIIKVYVLKTQAMYWETSHTVWTMHTAHYTGIWHIIQVYVLKTQAMYWETSHIVWTMHAYNSLYRSMFWKHRLCTEKPVTLSEPCIQPITQVWTMYAAHYKGLCSENTGLVLRNQSHCLNHQYSSLYRYMFSKHRLGTVKPVTLSGPCIQPITQV